MANQVPPAHFKTPWLPQGRELPLGGYPAISWADAVSAVQDFDLARLGRSEKQHRDYCEFLIHVQNDRWHSVGDYVRVAKLGFEQECNAAGELCAKSYDGPTKTLLLPNDFPYNFVDGIFHFVLWKFGADPVLTEDDFEFAKATLRASHNAVEFSVFINPPHMRSIKEVEHAQILFATSSALP